jgi:hypothetical protein
MGCAVLLLATPGCGTRDALSPSNLRVETRSDRSEYAQTDSFRGSFRFVNKTQHSIRAEFATTQMFDLAFYDSLGVEAFHCSMGAYQRVTYLELGPLGTHTTTLAFPFYDLPRGAYRVRGWVIGHDEIYSDASIEIR